MRDGDGEKDEWRDSEKNEWSGREDRRRYEETNEETEKRKKGVK